MLEFQSVTFAYDTAAAPVVDDLTVTFPTSWSGVIGANGSGKTTLLRLAAGTLTPTRGQVRTTQRAIICPQHTDDSPDDLRALIESTDADACRLRGELQLKNDWLTRWSTLSHGERKRAQLATALWQAPDALLIDEPTNHIDRPGREMLSLALRAFRGVGLLVSHDRELLDALCVQCLLIEPPHAIVRPGGYTQAIEQHRSDASAVRSARSKAQRELKRLNSEASNRRREASAADRKRSKRKLARGDSDGRAKIDAARVSGKDGQAGRKLRQLSGRVQQAQDKLTSLHASAQQRMGIELTGEPIRRPVLHRVDAQQIDLGGGRGLTVPELTIAPRDRIAVVGPNGAGKSTLIRHIVDTLTISPDRVVYLAQEIDRTGGRALVDAARKLPRAARGDVLSMVSRLGSDPRRVLESDEPSPGEARKLLLALGLARRPHLIIMDEPTNHMDLPSIECLEQALSACECALVLVSHDERFLGRLCDTRWKLTPSETQPSVSLHVERCMPMPE